MKKSDGFTLIEVLASIVILGLLLTSFFQFFIFSQKTTVNNKEKLVAVNIAQTVLEKIKEGSFPEITDKTANGEITSTKNFAASSSCTQVDPVEKNNCLHRYNKTVDNKNYYILVELGAKRENRLHNVTVKVYRDSGKYMSSVKGVMEL